MPRRAWLLLLSALLVSLSPSRAAAAPPPPPATSSAACEREAPEQPEISSSDRAGSYALLASARAELKTPASRAPVFAGHEREEQQGSASPALRARRAPGWSDLVQCRRCGGEHLLGYATPPPARG